MTTTRVSAAAVAAVARRLTRAGIARSVEINRAFSSGFDVYMQGDHVQVTWTTWPWEEHPAVMRRAQLALCAHALSDHYTVTRTTTHVAVPGGWDQQDVLEIRSERWGR